MSRGAIALVTLAAMAGCLSSEPEEPTGPPGKAPVLILQPPSDTSIGEGDVIRLEVEAEGEGPFQYQWYQDGEVLSGKTSSVLRVTAILELDSAVYLCVVTNAQGDTVSTHPILLRVNGMRITQEPADLAVTWGDSIRFSVAVSGGTAPHAYQWWGALGTDTLWFEGETQSSLAGIAYAEEALDGLSVWAEVTDANGAKVVSRKARLSILFAPSDTLSLGAQAHLTFGAAADLDSGRVMSASQANADIGKIDLVHLYYNDNNMLSGAAAARDSGIKYSVNLTNAYGVAARNITFVKVSAKPASQSLAANAYQTGPLLRAVRVAAGDRFIAKSSEDRFFYLEVRSVTGSASGALELVVYPGEFWYDPYDVF